MKIAHYTEQDWMLYVEGHLSLDEQSEMENHLYLCETCLASYMACVEHLSSRTSLYVADTERYMKNILAKTLGRKPVWHRSTMFHYGVAAAATLILVATGFFHGLSQELGSVGAYKPAPPLEAPVSLEVQVPLSDHLVNKTLSWLDTLQNNEGGLVP
jgi:anti-sigma factor RsiW